LNKERFPPLVPSTLTQPSAPKKVLNLEKKRKHPTRRNEREASKQEDKIKMGIIG
jgi:hypothetical protein